MHTTSLSPRSSALWVAGALALVTFVLGPSASGQSLLNQLEQRLQLPGGAPAGADPAAAPGTGYLGAVLDEAPEAGKGVHVNSVKEGGPAALGQLKANDLITSLDGKPVTGLPDLDAVLDRAVPGQTIRFTVQRGTQQQSLSIRLGNRPAAAAVGDQNPADTAPPTTAPALAPPSLALPGAAPPTTAPESLTPPTIASPQSAESSPRTSTPRPLDLGTPPGSSAAAPPSPDSRGGPPATASGPSLGITVVPLTEEARAAAGVPARRGALITQVRPGSVAERAGLPVGAVIVAADGRRIDSADDLVSVIRAARPSQDVELTYYEGSRMGRANVRLGSPAGGSATASPAPGYAGPGSAAPGDGGSPRFGGGNRPLLNRAERVVDGLLRGAAPPPAAPTTTSTVYDPLQMAALQRSVEELTAAVAALQQRLTALEAKAGGSSAPSSTPLSSPASSSPSNSGPSNPGFGGPGLSAPATSSGPASFSPPSTTPPASAGPGTFPGSGATNP